MAAPNTSKKQEIPRHTAFYIALGVGALAFLVGLWLAPRFALAIGVNVLFAVYLALVWVKTGQLTPEYLRKHADAADTPTWIIFGVVVLAVGVSAFELFRALNGGGRPAVEEIVVSVISVLLGWFTIHTMAALHYAYEFYESPSASPGKGKSGPKVGGLEFPDGDSPDGVAFLYFSYAIGTSTAVSDICVTSNKMRQLVMLHSVFSFFFNTLIVAAMVNVTVAVGAG